MIKKIEIKERDPKDLVIYASPKAGKTTIIASLTNKLNGKAVILNLEKGGTDYLEGYFLNCYEKLGDGYTEAFKTYKSYLEYLKQNIGQVDYLAIDNLSVLDEWADIAGTYFYMQTTQGKKFNRDEKGVMYTHTSPEWKSVTTLGEGTGWRFPREWFMSQIQEIMNLVPYRIWIVHIKDKFIKDTVTQETIIGSEMNLTGKIKNMLAARVSTISKLIAEGDKRYLSFENDNDSLIAGSRAPHLTGKVLISDKVGDVIETYWENVYNNLKAK
jgi:hypothetical protein